MGDIFELVLGLLCFAVPLLMGWVIGSSVERRHFSELDDREDRIRSTMIITQMKRPLYPAIGQRPAQIVTSEVVIATDYLKTFLAGWRSFFGGEVRSYRTLMERARREAVLRIIEEAETLGFNAVGNIRLSPCEIGGKAANAVILASGTAYHSNIAIRSAEPAAPTVERTLAPLDPNNPYQAEVASDQPDAT